jgi:hypothetical protein
LPPGRTFADVQKEAPVICSFDPTRTFIILPQFVSIGQGDEQ